MLRNVSRRLLSTKLNPDRLALEKVYNDTLDVVAGLPAEHPYRLKVEKFTPFFLNKLITSKSQEEFEAAVKPHSISGLKDALAVANGELHLAQQFKSGSF